jgi:hypothetical protein
VIEATGSKLHLVLLITSYLLHSSSILPQSYYREVACSSLVQRCL